MGDRTVPPLTDVDARSGETMAAGDAAAEGAAERDGVGAVVDAVAIAAAGGGVGTYWMTCA